MGEEEHFEESSQGQQSEEAVIRVKLPKKDELLGIVDIRLGFGKSRVICADGKTRICRVPGHLKRKLWVRPDNIVIVKPWEYEGDIKGDIVYKYQNNQADWLRKKGYLKAFEQQEF
ncbi:MAG: translation initiation factor eIF-1A [Nanoarchaeota archaeon]